MSDWTNRDEDLYLRIIQSSVFFFSFFRRGRNRLRASSCRFIGTKEKCWFVWQWTMEELDEITVMWTLALDCWLWAKPCGSASKQAVSRYGVPYFTRVRLSDFHRSNSVEMILIYPALWLKVGVLCGRAIPSTSKRQIFWRVWTLACLRKGAKEQYKPLSFRGGPVLFCKSITFHAYLWGHLISLSSFKIYSSLCLVLTDVSIAAPRWLSFNKEGLATIIQRTAVGLT